MPPDNINYMVQKAVLRNIGIEGTAINWPVILLRFLSQERKTKSYVRNNAFADHFRDPAQNMSRLDWFLVSFLTFLGIILSRAEFTLCSEKSYWPTNISTTFGRSGSFHSRV